MDPGPEMSPQAARELDLTDDGFLGGRLRILQPKRGYRAGIDAVLMAAAIPARAGECAFEAGLGVGTAALCLAHRISGLRVSGMEVQPGLADLARRNAARNALDEALLVTEGDALAAKALGLAPQSFDHVFANPPFFAAGSIDRPKDESRATAHLLSADLSAWIDALHWLAKPKASLTLVHRAEAVVEIAALMQGRFGDIRIFPLWPRASEAAARVIVQGRKGSRGEPKLLAGLVLHEAGTGFSPAAEACLRDGAALSLK